MKKLLFALVLISPALGSVSRADDVVVAGTTNARSEDFGGWAMLTGLDFPGAGCREIPGRYLGPELRFVVETVRAASLERVATRRGA